MSDWSSLPRSELLQPSQFVDDLARVFRERRRGFGIHEIAQKQLCPLEKWNADFFFANAA